MYSTPSPSVPSSPHLDQITQFVHALHLFVTESFVLEQTTSIGQFSEIPVGESVQTVVVKSSVGVGTLSGSELLYNGCSGKYSRNALYTSILGSKR